MLRANEPSKKQEIYFHSNVFRPFAVLDDIVTLNQIPERLEELIRQRIDGKRTEGGKLFFIPSEDSTVEFAILDGHRISGRWHRIDI